MGSDTDQAVNALNGRIDFTNKDLAATQESLHTTQNSLSDCFNEVAVVRSDLERNVADTEARLKNDIRQKQQEAFEKIGAVEQQALRGLADEGCGEVCAGRGRLPWTQVRRCRWRRS